MARLVSRYRGIYLIVFILILLGLLVTSLLQFLPQLLEHRANLAQSAAPDIVQPLMWHPEVTIDNTSLPAAPRQETCLFHTCFDVYQCGYNDENRVSVYIYPLRRYQDQDGVPITLPLSQEFSQLLQAVIDSPYYTTEPERACLFLPPIDLLNQNNLRQEETAAVLASLPHWNQGTNHLLFNMLPGSTPDYNTSLDVNHDRALVAGAGYSSWSYRLNYDVSIPVFNPITASIHMPEKSALDMRHWLLIAAQTSYHSEYRQELRYLADHNYNLLLLESCEGGNFSLRCHGGDVYEYPYVLQEGSFCLVVRGARLGQTALFDAMMAGCIPVVAADAYVMPFQEVIDWTRASLRIREEDLGQVMTVLSGISPERIVSMRRQVLFIWATYMSSMHNIALTTLQIINDRVFPYAATKYEDWNDPPHKTGVNSPLFLPLLPPRQAGFTAVILTYDRLDSLFKVINQVAQVPSLAKILVVWNNQLHSPPTASMWPKISKPLKVVQTRHNKLSNRFYPYDEVETEAILSLDDDILMLTPDEIQFGYEVWCEFPDRLVGFPSRLHLWDNNTQAWKYESEWTSQISIVLTGAAFHHKYYSYLYTNSMPGDIKGWVDEHLNCEDIAMNFLVSKTTGKPPIKVAPRQKFKCPECVNQNMLSATLTHMVERSECVNRFVRIYGEMPLKPIEFRADPVLYKDDLPTNLKRFNNVGSL